MSKPKYSFKTDYKNIKIKERDDIQSSYSFHLGNDKNKKNSSRASAIIHYDEISPHLHIVGVPIKIGGKNGMKSKLGKVMYLQKNHFVNSKIK